MLSDVDIKNEIGKNIFVLPLCSDNIRGNSLNLTASCWAWSLKTKKTIIENNNNQLSIKIPPNDTALIETQEVLYVSNKIGGTYHSKVALVSKGIGHIGTTLDPGWLGHSLIALHNNTDQTINIEVGQSIVSVIFHYLNKTCRHVNTNPPGQVTVLADIGISRPEVLDDEWRKNSKEFKNKMLQSADYKLFKQKIKNENPNYYLNKIIILYLIPVVVVIIIGLLLKNNKDYYKLYEIGFAGVLGALLVAYVNELRKTL